MGRRNAHHQRQEHVPCDFGFPRRVNLRVTVLGIEVGVGFAGDEAVDVQFNGLPVPEPACADG